MATPLTLAGTALAALHSGALWWPDEAMLCVADLHLGKSERIARRGGALLPPYETAETLDRLAADIARHAPRVVVCLGDSFDDGAGADALMPENSDRLATLAAGRDWIWIAGNHDPAPLPVAGRHLAELARGFLTFRHIARPDSGPGEVSGHWHPKARVALRGRTISRPCFLTDGARLILPAYGAYTGGLRSDHPDLTALLSKSARAILTGTPALTVPLAAATAPL
jgi:DNA ligase-associated metallophosphoesterase